MARTVPATRKRRRSYFISHDRAFIDNVCKRTLEISCGKIYDYKVNYSQFVELRKERVEQQMRAYENQQKQIADIKRVRRAVPLQTLKSRSGAEPHKTTGQDGSY